MARRLLPPRHRLAGDCAGEIDCPISPPGFASRWIDTSVGKIFARTGGGGPPLLLLHGYTQTNVMWHRVGPALASHFALVIPDLPGYGWSAVPAADKDHAPYDKRSMAKVMVT